MQSLLACRFSVSACATDCMKGDPGSKALWMYLHSRIVREYLVSVVSSTLGSPSAFTRSSISLFTEPLYSVCWMMPSSHVDSTTACSRGRCRGHAADPPCLLRSASSALKSRTRRIETALRRKPVNTRSRAQLRRAATAAPSGMADTVVETGRRLLLSFGDFWPAAIWRACSSLSNSLHVRLKTVLMVDS